MQLDWFTVGAQLVNFAVLVWLLRRFLYGPVVKAMDAREKGIRVRTQEAEEGRLAAQRELQTYQDRLAEIQAQREALLAESEDAAEARRHELIGEARQQVDETRGQWLAAIGQEQEAFLREMTGRTARYVCRAVRQVLADLADADLEQRAVEAFLRHLGRLSDEERKALVDALRQGGSEARVTSAFAIPEDARGRLKAELERVAGFRLTLRFETSPEMVAGIALNASGHKVSWSIEAYLGSMEEDLSRVLAEEITRQHEPTDHEEEGAGEPLTPAR